MNSVPPWNLAKPLVESSVAPGGIEPPKPASLKCSDFQQLLPGDKHEDQTSRAGDDLGGDSRRGLALPDPQLLEQRPGGDA